LGKRLNQQMRLGDNIDKANDSRPESSLHIRQKSTCKASLPYESACEHRARSFEQKICRNGYLQIRSDSKFTLEAFDLHLVKKTHKNTVVRRCESSHAC